MVQLFSLIPSTTTNPDETLLIVPLSMSVLLLHFRIRNNDRCRVNRWVELELDLSLIELPLELDDDGDADDAQLLAIDVLVVEPDNDDFNCFT